MAELGFSLELDILNHVDWPNRAIAEVWYAAAGCDYSKITAWLQEEIGVCVRIRSDVRRYNIVRILYELDGGTADRGIDVRASRLVMGLASLLSKWKRIKPKVLVRDWLARVGCVEFFW